MNRLLIPAFSILLLSALPAQAASGDERPGQADNAPQHRPPAAQRAAPQRAPVQHQRPPVQRSPAQQRPAAVPNRAVRQTPVHVAPPRQPQQQQFHREAQPPRTTVQPQASRPQPQPQTSANRSPFAPHPANAARVNDTHRSSQPNGESRQRHDAAPDRAKQNPPAAQRRPDARQAQQRDRRQGAAHTERYSGPHNYTPGHRPPPQARPRQFSQRDYNHNYQAAHRYHWRAYERPRGWYERRWYYGERLPPLFWARNYWIDDFWMFGLAIPPYGYEWVRYGDDALLINTDSGQILQVVYGIFY